MSPPDDAASDGSGRRLKLQLPLRRAIATVFTASLLVAAATLLAPWLYSSKALRELVASRLQEVSGLYVVISGDVRVALLPRPHVAMDSVALADRNAALHVQAKALIAPLNMLSLLGGAPDISAVQFVEPQISLDLEKQVRTEGAALRAAHAKPATVEAQNADRAKLGVISTVDGVVRLRRQGHVYRIDRLNASLEWRRVGEPISFNAAFEWAGQRHEALIWITRPAELLRDGETIATARIDGETFRAEAQGVAQLGANARFVGRVGGSAASGRETLKLFGLAFPLPSPFLNSQFSAQANISSQDAKLEQVLLIADGNEFEGSAVLRADDGEVRLGAELRSALLSARPYLAEAPALTGSDGQWSREAFDLQKLPNADIDIKITAKRARLDRLALDNATFIVASRSNSLDFEVTDAQAYKGAMKFRAGFRRNQDGLTARSDLVASGVDAGALLRDSVGNRTFTGLLDATLAVDAAGSDMASLMRTLHGRLSAQLMNGEIDGLDLERALRRLDRRPLASALDVLAGRTVFDKAVATVTLENGIAEFKDGEASGAGYVLKFSGNADLPERTLKVLATASDNLRPKDQPATSNREIAFSVSGAWDDLRLTTDTDAFIRRSHAAAPLLPGRVDANSRSAAEEQ